METEENRRFKTKNNLWKDRNDRKTKKMIMRKNNIKEGRNKG